MAGPSAEIISAVLRSTRTQIVGSGIGSVAGRCFRTEVPKIAKAVSNGAFDIRARTLPLDAVADAWTRSPDSDERIVFLP
ncbi:MAG: hypothetical protein WCE30_06515 [Mycobacterium sp.]